MPRFPLLDQIALPVTFESYMPGNLHPDGRRYLPLLIFKLASGVSIGVVDRHHLVEPHLAGRAGVARLVFLLSSVELQPPGMTRQGIFAESFSRSGMTTTPEAYGRIVAVPSWEVQQGHLPYDSLYTELVLDTGDGTIGVRTHVTADDLAARLGKAQLAVGDWIGVSRSRVDVLGFDVAN
ncbi:MAG TPA: hypothetical protein VFZ66_19860 [Herpetosiphonaceae bacterium]